MSVATPRVLQMRLPLDPADWVEGLDLDEALAELREAGPVGEVSLSIVGLPDNVIVAIDRLRVRTEPRHGGTTKTSQAEIVDVLLAHGVLSLNRNAYVQDLARIKEDFELLDGADADAEDVMSAWFKAFPVATSVAGKSAQRRNYWIRTGVKKELSGLADDLGTTNALLAVVLLMATLSQQDAVTAGQRERMAVLVTAFMNRLRYRATGARALMEAIMYK